MSAGIPAEFWESMCELYEHEDDSRDHYDEEEVALTAMVTAVAEHLAGSYAVEEPVGRGGAGVVLRVRDTRLEIDRALKLPRPHSGELVESIANERDHLLGVSHANIIQIYSAGDVPVPETGTSCPYFVMDFVDDAVHLRKRLEQELDVATTTHDMQDITRWLAGVLADTASALNYLHDRDTIHFDVKPTNVLVTRDSRPLLSDLGFAKKKGAGPGEVTVGFTHFYAHPDLREHYYHASDMNRVLKQVAPVDFSCAWDTYALGKAILELLALIDSAFPDAVSYDYCFAYLHLSACRMLDGRNLSDDEVTRIREKQVARGDAPTVYREWWLNITSSEAFENIKYGSMLDVYTDLDGISAGRDCGSFVPELDIFCTKRIQTSGYASGPFTDRVKSLVEHPCFARLHAVAQLGFANTVYPGATHTRLEHSIGVFERCTAYVRALYNDPYNPLFRQLCSEQDLRCVVVASLLHDLGQYPLAHEFEEHARELVHEKLTVRWLDNQTLDKHGHTLGQIITADWHVELDQLKKLLKGTDIQEDPTLFAPPDLKMAMLSSIIDGALDVDKLDYLIRDSENAGLPYGLLIDHERLVLNLTTVAVEDDRKRETVVLATYEKGKSAAESLTFARYLLYDALYWHHTLRAIRVMLWVALEGAITKGKNGPEGFAKRLEDFLGLHGVPEVVNALNMMTFLEGETDQNGKTMIDMIRARKLYKRILTVHSKPSGEGGRAGLIERFRSVHRKPGFAEALRARLYERLEAHAAVTPGPQASALAPDRARQALDALRQPHAILTDCPQPPYGGRDKLRFIPEPQRLRQNYLSRVEVGERVSEVWEQVFFRLMGIASKGRVYCHPDVRDPLMAALGPAGIATQLEATIREFER